MKQKKLKKNVLGQELSANIYDFELNIIKGGQSHRTDLDPKLAFNNTAEMMQYALKNGIIRTEN